MSLTVTAGIEFFKNFDMFKTCSNLFLEAVAHQAVEKVYSAGTTIFQQGEIGTCMLMLKSGEVEILVDENQVATLTSGSIVGEMAVLSKKADGKRQATVRAKSMCFGWCIDRSQMVNIFTAFPSEREIIAKFANQRLKALQEKGLLPSPNASRRRWMLLAPQKEGAKLPSARKKLKMMLALGHKANRESTYCSGEATDASDAERSPQRAADSRADSSLKLCSPKGSVLETTVEANLARTDCKASTFPTPSVSPRGEWPMKEGPLPMLSPRRPDTPWAWIERPDTPGAISWKDGETAAVSNARLGAVKFLFRRGMLP